MKKRIFTTLTNHPSYFKKGKTFLMRKFNCSERTLKEVLTLMKEQKDAYYENCKRN